MLNTANTIDSLDDEQLLVLIGRGRDKIALAELYDRYRHNLGNYLRRKMHQDSLVDEIYNDVMHLVWQKADEYRGDSTVKTWIFGIAYRLCLERSRKESKHNQNRAGVEFDDIPSSAGEIQKRIELNEVLRKATEKLGESHRVVIELAYFHGYNLEEIADIVESPVNTVKTRLFHARQNLRAIIGQQTAIFTV
ncbi:MAG: RNA polymerase sigma factor [Pseudomonadota bacterium]